jgi:AAHS family 4-hydroxybenzoate transporter-like MFS transporter
MLSASFVGNMIGLPIFGAIGDRYGRKPAIIFGCFLFGLSTLAVVAAENVWQVTILRFITGLGMCGLLPNIIALNSELAPGRVRARLITLMFMGITAGSSMPGLVAYWAVPLWGWRAIFWMGGGIAMIVAALLVVALPESVRYLAMRPGRERALLGTMRRMRPDLAFDETSRFTFPTPTHKGVPVGAIFRDGLAPVTLMLWLCMIATLLANFFIGSWMPSLFEAKGFTPPDAAFAVTWYHLGGTLGGLAMSFLLDRYGCLAIGWLMLVAAPATLAVSIPGLSLGAECVLLTLVGFTVLGGQFGLNAVSGLVYPTAFRSLGIGIALAVGRIGSISGPNIGAAMIGAKLPLWSLLGTIAIDVAIGALAAFALGWFAKKRFGSWRLGEAADADAAGLLAVD